MSSQPVCFVVMGFGKKTAYSKDKPPRVLDLDATFEAIIEPAVLKAGYQCIRADRILHSGMIDVPMYEMLHQADLVIADISTGNVNAVYELGVRHALKSKSTIIMKEEQGDFSFDLNHISTFTYEHLGSDIGTRVAKTKVAELCALILATAGTKHPDSPVYICLPDLAHQAPEPDVASTAMPSRLESASTQPPDPLAEHLGKGRQAMKSSDFVGAAQAFSAALSVLERSEGPPNAHGDYSFIIQQLALATYKRGEPSKKQALADALTILSALSPPTSGDIETLGIAGAIHKRIYEELDKTVGSGDPETLAHLDRAVEYYGRGYHLARDYYNGENYVTCLSVRAALQQDPDEAICDRTLAQRVCNSLITDLKRVIDIELLETRVDTNASGEFKKSFFQRSDWDWMLATMANCLYATGHDGEAERYERIILEAADSVVAPRAPNAAVNWDYGNVALEPWTTENGETGWKLATYWQSRSLAQRAASTSSSK